MKRALLVLAVLIGLAAAAAAGSMVWLLRTESGLRWVVAQAESASGGALRVENARGTLSGTWQAQSVGYAANDTQVRARGASGSLELGSVLAGRAGLEGLRIESLQVKTDAGEPAAPGESLSLPLGLELDDAVVERIEVQAGDAEPVVLTDLRIESARVGPRALAARGEVTRPDERWPATIGFEVDGTFDAFVASFEGKAGPVLLQARLQRQAQDGGYAGTLSLENAQPGPVDRERLPVASAHTRFESADLERAQLHDLRIELAGGGELLGGGEVSANGVQLELKAGELDLSSLYSRLRKTALQGMVQLEADAGRQSVRARLGQDDMSVRAHLTRKDDTIELHELHASARGGTLRGGGTVELGEALSAHARLEFVELDPSAFGSYPQGDLNGHLELEARAGKQPQLEARWTIEGSRLAGEALASQGRATLTAERVSQARAEVSYGPAQLELRGAFGRRGDELAWSLVMREPGLRAEGTLEGTLQAHTLGFTAQLPEARVRSRLAGAWEDGAWRGEIRALESSGGYALRLEAPAPLTVSPERVRLGRLEAALDKGRILVREAIWRSDGPVAASGELTRPDERWPAKLRFEIDGALDAFVASLEGNVGPVPLQARLQAQAQGGGYAGTLSLENAQPGPLDRDQLPVASVHTRFESTDLQRAQLHDIRIALAGRGALAGAGEASANGVQLELDARALDLAALYSSLRKTALQGTLQLEANAEQQSVRGRLEQDDMSLRAHLTRKGDTIEVHELHASARGGAIRGSGSLELGETLTAQAKLELAKLDPSAFGSYPQGELNGHLELEARAGKQPQVEARWTIESSRLAGEALASQGRATLTRERVSQAQAQLSYGRTRLDLRGAFGQRGDELAWTLVMREPGLRAEGTLEDTLQAHTLGFTAKLPEARVRAQLAGGWKDGAWRGELRALESTGEYPLRLVTPAPLTVSPERVRLGRFEAALDKGRLLVREATWRSGGPLASSGEFTALPARWLVLAAGAGGTLRSTLLLDGEWSLSADRALAGRLQVRRRSGDLALDFDGDRLPLDVQTLALDARAGEDGVTLQLDAASGFGKLTLQGTIGNAPGSAAIGAASPLALQARLDAAALSVVARPVVTAARLDGQLWAELEITGTLGDPRLDGQLRGESIALDIPPYGVYLGKGTLLAELEGNRLRLEKFEIHAATGRFTARGALPLGPEGGATELSWSAENLSVLQRPDMRLTVSGEGAARFDGRRFALTGRVLAEQGRLEFLVQNLPRPGDDVVIAGSPPEPKDERPPLPVDLDLEIDLGENLELQTGMYEGRLAGEVRLATNETGELRAHGRVRSVNGIVRAYDRRLEVDPGELLFDGPLRNPALKVTAWRRDQAVEVGIQISGTLQNPRITLVSVPPVPQAERLSWLVLGRPPGDASKADLGLLRVAASALLTKGDSVPFERRVARTFGLDELTVRGAGEAEGSVIAVGKRLSTRLYIAVEQGLGATATNLVKLDYALGRRWSLRAEAGSTSGAGLFYRFSWD